MIEPTKLNVTLTTWGKKRHYTVYCEVDPCSDLVLSKCQDCGKRKEMWITKTTVHEIYDAHTMIEVDHDSKVGIRVLKEASKLGELLCPNLCRECFVEREGLSEEDL